MFCHYIRKADPSEIKEETSYPHTIQLEELMSKQLSGEKLHIIDVREPAEYAFGHLQGAVSIPAGELESRLSELDSNASYYIVCRTGSRSDRVCQTLADKGFKHVTNVLPGMSGWTGELKQDV
ncbi:Thiosulfate sulfurtransferase PspE precursor [compost metagenome]